MLVDDKKMKELPVSLPRSLGYERIIRLIAKMYKEIKVLFRKPLSVITALSCTMLFSNMYGYVYELSRK